MVIFGHDSFYTTDICFSKIFSNISICPANCQMNFKLFDCQLFFLLGKLIRFGNIFRGLFSDNELSMAIKFHRMTNRAKFVLSVTTKTISNLRQQLSTGVP